MSYLYRCQGSYKKGPFKGQRCQQRHQLKRKVEDYARPPRCKSCGNLITYMDNWQMKKNKETTCNCGGPYWPHREGSHILCARYTGDLCYEEYEAALRDCIL